jgi:Ca2+-binding EF-hand superfamily protein
MLTEFQKRKLTNLFNIHDLNHDGALERSDYDEYIRRLAGKRGVAPGSPKYDALSAQFLRFWDMLQQIADQNQDKRVTLREWFACFERLMSSPSAAEEMQPIGDAVFAMLDRNNDGVVTLEEYRWLYSSGGLDPSLAADSFRHLDTDHDSRITTAELSSRLFEFLSSDDPRSPGTWLFGPVATEREAVRT